jgi:hypothetical protein
VDSWFTWQTPLALQVSGLSHTVSEESPQAVPAFALRSAGQVPSAEQFSGKSQTPPARHSTLVDSWFTWQTPLALQVSGLSHTVSEESPQAKPVRGMCTGTWFTQRPPPVQSALDSQTVCELFEHVPWHTSRVQGLVSATAMQKLGNVAQLHFDFVPALTSAGPLQVKLAPGWFQVSQ